MKKYIVIALLIVLTSAVKAQHFSSFRMHYDVAVPLGDFSDYIDRASWRGVSIDSRWEVNPKVTAGFNLGWQVFSQRFDNVTEVLSSGRTTVNGTQFRFVNTYPMQVNAHYYLGEEYSIRPWAGLSVGTAFTDQRTQVGFIEIKDTSWSFALTPQVGIDIPVDSNNTCFTFNVRYNYFSQNTVSHNYSFLIFGVGFKFGYY
ncbi:MAG: hypothetical protein KF687_16130 [Cyclobacteriaceae bacterium]|nr:hypothetical protein [Cyclobacteriaceae bacterium]